MQFALSAEGVLDLDLRIEQQYTFEWISSGQSIHGICKEFIMDLSVQFLKLLVHFRHQNLREFTEEHVRLYTESESSGDYGECIAHYYSVMSKIIDASFGGSFHFVPPISETRNLSDSLKQLHIRIGKSLNLGPDKCCLDIGCGIGQVIEDLAPTGANFLGLTIAPNEVKIGNANFETLGIYGQCKLLEADCTKMLPLSDASQDAAYAIYSLKYFPNLGPIFAELARVLKPGGLFMVYDLLISDKFDEKEPKQSALLAGISAACGMPPLHSRAELLHASTVSGFTLVRATDLQVERGLPFYHCFISSPFFMWIMRSKLVGKLIKLAEMVHFLPRGFYGFNKIFLAGTVDKIVRAGKMGILSGSEMLLFQKKE